MIYSAVGLAVFGIATGLAFRWKVLLPIIVLLPFAATFMSLSSGLSLEDTLMAILVAEAVLQCGYFAGLLIRFMATAVMRSSRASSLLKRRRDRKAHDNKHEHTVGKWRRRSSPDKPPAL
jgi:hypothetical protein